MKIVFLETETLGSDIDLSIFDGIGEVVKYPLSDKEKNASRIEDADVVILNKIIVNEELIGNAKNLKLICLTATGTNNVDFDCTRKHKVAVTNVKGYSTQSVIQHTFALLFYLYEKLSYYDEFVKSGDYIKNDVFSHFKEHFNELYGKTWGIIGLGEIGNGVAQVAKAFGCNIVYYSTSGKNNNSNYKRTDLDTLLKLSDIVSIHAPLNESTKNLINADTLGKMKKTAYLLNLGRGPIINEKDLADALNNNAIAGAGLDVLCEEPMSPNNPLKDIKDSRKLLITPHIAWATVEARKRCITEVYNNILAFLDGEKLNRVD